LDFNLISISQLKEKDACMLSRSLAISSFLAGNVLVKRKKKKKREWKEKERRYGSQCWCVSFLCWRLNIILSHCVMCT